MEVEEDIVDDIEARRQAVIDAAIAWQVDDDEYNNDLDGELASAVLDLKLAMRPDIRAALVGAMAHMNSPCHRCYAQNEYDVRYARYVEAFNACRDAVKFLDEDE